MKTSRVSTIMVMIMVAGLLAISIMAIAARAETPRRETVDAARITVIDGDTIDLACHQVDCTQPERIRILNIDAPEIGRARCPAEREMGLEARAALIRLLAGQLVTIERCEPAAHPTYPARCTDRYGRTLARLATPAGDIGQLMLNSGHVLPWQPGRAAWQQRAAIFCGVR